MKLDPNIRGMGTEIRNGVGLAEIVKSGITFKRTSRSFMKIFLEFLIIAKCLSMSGSFESSGTDKFYDFY